MDTHTEIAVLDNRTTPIALRRAIYASVLMLTNVLPKDKLVTLLFRARDLNVWAGVLDVGG
jgi:hypothetical protein